MRKSFDDKIKQRLENYKEEPSGELWQKIATEVPSDFLAWTKVLTLGASIVTTVCMTAGLYINHVAQIDHKSNDIDLVQYEENIAVNDSMSAIFENNENGSLNESSQKTPGGRSDEAGIKRVHPGKSDSDTDRSDGHAYQRQHGKDSPDVAAPGTQGLSYLREDVPANANTKLQKRTQANVHADQSSTADKNFYVDYNDKDKDKAGSSEAKQQAYQNVENYPETIREVTDEELARSKNEILSHVLLDDSLVANAEESMFKYGSDYIADTLLPVEKRPLATMLSVEEKVADKEDKVKGAGQEPDGKHLEAKEEKNIKIRKGSLYFLAMPTFGYNRIEPNKNDNIAIAGIQRVPPFSMKRLGVRLEAGFEYPVAKRIHLTGGFLYYQRKQTLNYTERMVDSVSAVNVGENFLLTPDYSYVEHTFEYELKNVGIHIGATCLLSKGKFVHSIGTGVEFQWSLKKASIPEATQSMDNGAKTFLFYNLFYRLQYPAEGRFRAIFQPTLNYSFYINEGTNAPFYVKPYGLGLNFGVSYKF